MPDYTNTVNSATAGGPNPYFQPAVAPAPATVRTSPVLAFILGWIPGVGAIYNGQYLKGLVHALIFGLLITIIDSAPPSAEALTGVLMAAFVFYMPFEAYHTAKKREMGVPVDEWSSILPSTQRNRRAPIGPIVLIAIGVLYLLNSLNLIDFHQIARFWPVILIVLGAYMLYNRVTAPSASRIPPTTSDAANPRPADFVEPRHE